MTVTAVAPTLTHLKLQPLPPPTIRRKNSVLRKCGIIGIYKREDSGAAAPEIYEGLLMLQHRGQDSAGIVSTDWTSFHEKKDNGLVKDVFEDKATMAVLTGSAGLGHVRYPTAGSSDASEAQPFFVNSPLGMYLVHNGNLTNTDALRRQLASSTSFFDRHMRTSSDSEVLLNVLADEVHRAHQEANAAYDACVVDLDDDATEEERAAKCGPGPDWTEPGAKAKLLFSAGERLMKMVEGAYSCVTLVKGVGLVCFRDPLGIRPLVLGRRLTELGAEYCVASEDCAFGPLGFDRVRDILPGEMVVVTPTGDLLSQQCAASPKLNPCIFEYIYLSRPDSVLNDVSVYDFQLGLGTRLAERVAERGWEVDCVVPVPDGSRPAAIQMAAVLGLPYREGLVKNRYVGRTFIMPDQRTRELSVRRKLNAMPSVFQGRSVLLVDDSIVRGTTMAQIVSMVRKAGAARVYMASAAPAVRHPNVYGVDMPSRKELVAAHLTEDEVCAVLGCDGLLYQTVEDMVEVGRGLNPLIEEFDAACFTGHYVTGVTSEYLDEVESNARGKGRDRAGANIGSLAGANAGAS